LAVRAGEAVRAAEPARRPAASTRSGKVVCQAEGSDYRQPLPITETPSGTPNTVSLPDGAALQQLMGQLNGIPGPRVVPGRSIPVPNSVSAAMQQTIAMPYRNNEWQLNPPDAAGWNAAITTLAQQSIVRLRGFSSRTDRECAGGSLA
jgi:hypothetical protein